jgi:hypothetical protein
MGLHGVRVAPNALQRARLQQRAAAAGGEQPVNSFDRLPDHVGFVQTQAGEVSLAWSAARLARVAREARACRRRCRCSTRVLIASRNVSSAASAPPKATAASALPSVAGTGW